MVQQVGGRSTVSELPRLFELTVAPHVDEMYRLAAAIVGVDDARDVTQDALVAAWRAADRLAGVENVRAWLHTIVVNQARNTLRTRSRRPRTIHVVAAESIGSSSEAGLRAVEDRERLDRAFEALDADQRALLSLRYSLDLTVPQVAQVLGIPDGTVKSRLHTAAARVRSLLGEDDR